MDALALLCNLYGDGPATLRRLREAGYAALGDLGRMPVDELTVILGGSPAQARRFQHEATLLAERARELIEPESSSRTDTLRTDALRTDTPIAAPVATPHRDPKLERALAAWRAADAAEQDGAQAATPSLAQDEERDFAAAAPGTPLRAELVDGLDEALCARFRAAGLFHAEDLLGAELLELATVCEVPLTRLLRIVGHMRRLVAAESPGLLVPQPRRGEARFSPDPLAAAFRERSSDESEPRSGPFA